MIWQEHLTATLLKMGFRESKIKPGLFRHCDRDVDLCVHVDDILCAGRRASLKWFKETLKSYYEVESEVKGDDSDLAKEFTYLGRLVTWNCDLGIQVQPDRRHVQRLLKDLGLEQTQGVQSPWAVNTKVDKSEEVVDIRQRRDERPEMEPRAARRHQDKCGEDCIYCARQVRSGTRFSGNG